MAIRKTDVMELMHIQEGKQVGEVLAAALEEVTSGRIPNARTALTGLLSAWNAKIRPVIFMTKITGLIEVA